MAEKRNEQKPAEPDGLLALAVRKKGGRFQVFTVSRVAGKQEETILKDTDDKRIAADKLQTAVFQVKW